MILMTHGIQLARAMQVHLVTVHPWKVVENLIPDIKGIQLQAILRVELNQLIGQTISQIQTSITRNPKVNLDIVKILLMEPKV